jgi:hypothetical protein
MHRESSGVRVDLGTGMFFLRLIPDAGFVIVTSIVTGDGVLTGNWVGIVVMDSPIKINAGTNQFSRL